MFYKTIFFDWDGTLCISQFWEHWASQHPQKFAQIQLALFQQRPDLITPWMIGQISAEDCVSQISETTGLDLQELMQNLELSCRHMQFIDPQTPELLARVRQSGTKVVIATNNMDTFQRWTIESLGLSGMVDHILNSAELGALKASPAQNHISPFFGRYLQENAIAPGQSLLIDDVSNNSVVKQFGIDFMPVPRGQGIVEAIKQLGFN